MLSAVGLGANGLLNFSPVLLKGVIIINLYLFNAKLAKKISVHTPTDL